MPQTAISTRLANNAGVMLNKFAAAFQGHMPNFNMKELAQICRMKIKDFHNFGKKIATKDGNYFFQDNGADILAVAHLDSVLGFHHFDVAKLKQDTRIFCTNLDDRLGAYLILKYLSKLGLKFDVLLTENEEKGRSTAMHFVPPNGKKYKWMFQFDRAGVGCVTYNYYNLETTKALKEVGLDNARGIYSDICNLEHLGCAGFNFGVGYHDHHSMDAYASKRELVFQVNAFLKFYQNNKDRHFVHVPKCNVFSYMDGFEYDPTVKERFFTRDEYMQGLLILEEAAETESFSLAAFSSRMTASEFVAMLSYQKKRSEEKPRIIHPTFDRGSEDKPQFTLPFEPKMGVAVIHHLDVSPEHKSPYDVVKEALTHGKKSALLDKCLHCGNEYEVTENSILVTCPNCRKKDDPLPLTHKTINQESVQTRTVDFKIGAIKTKLPINLGGVRAEYRLKIHDSKNKAWEWKLLEKPVSKPVGFVVP